MTAQRGNACIAYTSEVKYINPARDTLYDGWIKIVTFSALKEVKVIAYDNDIGYGRYYIANIDGYGNGESINIFQSANQESPL